MSKKQPNQSDKKSRKLKLNKKTLKDLSTGNKDIKGGGGANSAATKCKNDPNCYRPIP